MPYEEDDPPDLPPPLAVAGRLGLGGPRGRRRRRRRGGGGGWTEDPAGRRRGAGRRRRRRAASVDPRLAAAGKPGGDAGGPDSDSEPAAGLTESGTEPADFGAVVPSMSKLRHPLSMSRGPGALADAEATAWLAEATPSPGPGGHRFRAWRQLPLSTSDAAAAHRDCKPEWHRARCAVSKTNSAHAGEIRKITHNKLPRELTKLANECGISTFSMR